MQANFILEWESILNFICSLYFLLTQTQPISRKHQI